MTAIRKGDVLHGFEVVAVTPVDELRASAIEFEHRKSGARVLHLHAADSENLFSIGIPTPPTDDTGVPHILEHSVLAGSRKYPVREPFFEMVKMSMATFINAMTGWDCTYYPVASNVPKDLFNLADVYFDAVFHPLLEEETFEREGHHLAPAVKDDPSSALTISGIVYNEMKGAFSDPESLLYRLAARTLFGDTMYGRESGGDPDHIPSLTYDQLKQFHATYYHPSHALFILYGDIPTDDYLAFLSDKLDAFERRPPIVLSERQPRWPAPRRIEDTYPVEPGEETAGKTYLLVEWLAGDAADPAHLIAIEILDLVLLGNEAAPLKKAVIDSGLGNDLLPSGNATIGLQTSFRIALKGAEPERADAFLALVLDTLAGIAARPIDRALVDAAFQQSAYSYREISSLFPLHVMDHVLDAWLYGLDPLTFMHMNRGLDECRARYEADPMLFNRMIRELFLDNPHRLLVVLRPDPRHAARERRRLRARMKALKESLSADELAGICRRASELDRLSGTPNPPEAIATLPQLCVRDLPPRPRHVPTTIERLDGGAVWLRNDVFSNGVNYLQFNVDLAGLPEALWPFVPRYVDAVGKMGAAGMGYAEVAGRVAAATGGIYCSPSLLTHAVSGEPAWGMRIGMKALDDQVDAALEIFGALFFAVDPRDRARLRDVMIQARSHYSTELVQSGSHTAVKHAARGFNPECHLLEQIDGLPQMALCDRAVAGFDGQHEALMAGIEAIRDFLLCGSRLTISFTGSDKACGRAQAAVAGWLARMRGGRPGAAAPTGFTPYTRSPREGLAGPIQIAHCARVLPAPHASHPDSALLMLGAHIVGLDYLMSEVRFKGNAYGASCSYNPLARTLSLGSFRDPHIVRTLRVFDAVADYVAGCRWSMTDIERTIIGVAKQAEQPIRPAEATSLAMLRHITGQTRAVREDRYARLLAATPAEIRRALLAALEEGMPRSAICVVSNRAAMEKANRALGRQKLEIEDILGTETMP